MEGKILISQELPLEVQHFDTCTFISQKYADTNEEECVDVESKNRRQLALAICPELQSELEKANKEIDIVEQERYELFFKLEKAKELIEMAQNLTAGTSKESFERFDRFMKQSTTFLEGSGN